MNNITKEQIDYFLSLSSYSGLQMLYVSYCANITKKPFTFKDLGKSFTFFISDYFYGYFVACVSFGLFNYVSNGDIYNITKFDDYLYEKIETFIKKESKEFDSTKDAEWNTNFSRTKQIKEIEEYFNYTPKITV